VVSEWNSFCDYQYVRISYEENSQSVGAFSLLSVVPIRPPHRAISDLLPNGAACRAKIAKHLGQVAIHQWMADENNALRCDGVARTSW
jgi:hypothetical protein